MTSVKSLDPRGARGLGDSNMGTEQRWKQEQEVLFATSGCRRVPSRSVSVACERSWTVGDIAVDLLEVLTTAPCSSLRSESLLAPGHHRYPRRSRPL